jgi:hypothetical protein
MKNLKFVDLCKGIMFLLIGIGIASFGIASISNNSAKADSPNTVNSTGKIMMSESGFLLNGKAMYHILVWDTETGKSKLYYLGTATGKFHSADYQLPASPIY